MSICLEGFCRMLSDDYDLPLFLHLDSASRSRNGNNSLSVCTYLSAPCGSSGVQSGVALCADGPFFSALSGQRYYILLEDVRAGSKICCLLEPFLSLSKAQFTSSQSVAKMKFILAGALLASLISLGNAQLEEAELTVAGLGHSKPPKPYTCPKYCHFPPHSLPKCSLHLPCGFSCKDGYVSCSSRYKAWKYTDQRSAFYEGTSRFPSSSPPNVSARGL